MVDNIITKPLGLILIVTAHAVFNGKVSSFMCFCSLNSDIQGTSSELDVLNDVEWCATIFHIWGDVFCLWLWCLFGVLKRKLKWRNIHDSECFKVFNSLLPDRLWCLNIVTLMPISFPILPFFIFFTGREKSINKMHSDGLIVHFNLFVFW